MLLGNLILTYALFLKQTKKALLPINNKTYYFNNAHSIGTF